MGQRPRPPGKAQHSLPTTQSKRSVFRLLSSQTERRRRQQWLPPSEAGRHL